MGSDAINGIITVVTMIVVVAIVAVLVSNKASTGSVLTAGGKALASVIGSAVAPVTGSVSAANTEIGNVGGLNLGSLSLGTNPFGG